LNFLSLLSEAALDRQARILHLFVTLPVGGAENLLLSIVRRLDHERFASVVCCIGKRGVMGDQLAAALADKIAECLQNLPAAIVKGNERRTACP